MSPALQPAHSDHSDDTTPASSPAQQSAGMAHGTTPQENAYNQSVSDSNSQNNMNNATGGGRRTRRRRPTKSKKSKKSKRRMHKSRRRKSKRRTSRRIRGKKSKKGKKHKKKSMRGGSSQCGEGYVMAEVNTPMYPDRGGGDQTVDAQTTLAQSNGMNMEAQSALDSNVPEPQS